MLEFHLAVIAEAQVGAAKQIENAVMKEPASPGRSLRNQEEN